MRKILCFLVAAALVILSREAVAAGLFEAFGGGNDLGNAWLSHIFNGDGFVSNVPAIDGAGNPTAGGTTTTISGAIPVIFRQLAGMYSSAMLVLAVIILVYHLIAMLVHTAHEGTALGRSAHQVWTPVRLVFALGLLIPIANGFSSGQWLVFWIAKQGSNLASYVWSNIGGGFMSQGSRTVVASTVSPETIVNQLFDIGWCAKEHQRQLASNAAYYLGYVGENLNPPYPLQMNATAFYAQDVRNALVMPMSATATVLNHPAASIVENAGKDIVIAGDGINSTRNFSKYYYPVSQGTSPLQGGTGAWEFSPSSSPCGKVIMPAAPADPNAAGSPEAAAVAALQAAQMAAYNKIEYPAMQIGASSYIARERREGDKEITIPMYQSGGGFTTIFQNMFNDSDFGWVDLTVKGGIQAAQKSMVKAYWDAFAKSLNQSKSGLTYCGAGAARGAGSPCDGVPNGQIVYNPPAFAIQNARLMGNAGIGTTNDLGWMAAGGFYVNLATKNNALSTAAGIIPTITNFKDCGLQADCSDKALEDNRNIQKQFDSEKTSLKDGFGKCDFDIWHPHVGDYIECKFRAMLSFFGITNANGQFVWYSQFTSPHPFADVINLGSRLVDGAVWLFGAGMALTTLSAGVSLTPFVTVGVVGIQIAAMFFFVASLIFLPGVMLFYVLPLLPFFNFLLGIVTWFISLLQAVVAIPIIAIGHLSPHGEGLPSQAVRGAYTMLLQIFLRPVMMIFGLIVAVLVMNTGIMILNTLFFGVYKHNAIGDASGIVSNIIFFILYTLAAFAIVHASITAIDDFPLKSVQWIGGGSVDRDHPINSIAAATAVQKADSAIQGASSGVNRSAAGFVAKRKQMHDANKIRDEERRYQAMLEANKTAGNIQGNATTAANNPVGKQDA